MKNDPILGLERVHRSLSMACGRGAITTVSDTQGEQIVQIKLGPEVRDKTPRMAEWGFVSNPPSGSDGVLLCNGGDRSNGIVIATGNMRYRLTGLASGEVAIHDDLGQCVYLTRSGIVIKGAGLPITVEGTPKLTVTATSEVELNTPKLLVDGQIVATGDILDNSASQSHTMAQMRSIYNSHTHSGVQTGSGSTGTPSASE